MLVNKKVEKNVIKMQYFGNKVEEIDTKSFNCTYKINKLTVLAFLQYLC